MKPTDKQKEFIAFAKAQKLPVAWLGTVRAGKTVGALMALTEVMKERPGDYALTSVGHIGLDRNLIPVLERILTEEEIAFKAKKSWPKSFETEYGNIWCYSAGDERSQNQIQGITLRGAFSDEVLLYPQSFIMQLIARFSHDDPFWVMSANKTQPNHWIKTDWIDSGKIALFESTVDDNPHISSDVRLWWNTLIEGKYKDRMMNNEWSNDYGMIGVPLKRKSPPKRHDKELNIYSIWLDEGRGCAIVRMVSELQSIISVNHVMWVDDPKSVRDRLSGSPELKVCNLRDGFDSGLTSCAEFKPDAAKYARSFTEMIDRVRLDPSAHCLEDHFKRWAWVSADAQGTSSKPDECDVAVLACVQGVHFLKNNRPILKKQVI